MFGFQACFLVIFLYAFLYAKENFYLKAVATTSTVWSDRGMSPFSLYPSKIRHGFGQQVLSCRTPNLEQVMTQFNGYWSCVTFPGYLLHSSPELTWYLSNLQAWSFSLHSNKFSLYFRLCHFLLFATKCPDDIGGIVKDVGKHITLYPHSKLTALKSK